MCFLLIFTWHRSSMLISHTYITLHCSLNRSDIYILRCPPSLSSPPAHTIIQQIRRRVNKKRKRYERASQRTEEFHMNFSSCSYIRFSVGKWENEDTEQKQRVAHTYDDDDSRKTWILRRLFMSCCLSSTLYFSLCAQLSPTRYQAAISNVTELTIIHSSPPPTPTFSPMPCYGIDIYLVGET